MMGGHQCFNLISPIAGMAEPTVEEDHGRPVADHTIPNRRTPMLHSVLFQLSREGGRASLRELLKG